jgi:hypothetical protein
MTHPKNELLAILTDLAFGLGLSGIVAKIMPEAVHAISTIITGLTLTACIFFLNRWLRKTFPEGKRENKNQ